MRKIHLFILLNLLGSMVTKAQSAMELVRPPQITDMIRHDNTPVALCSGRLDLNIPLIGIEDKDFKFPVTASYNSAGFMPTKPETILGLNWSLALGGVIYREVKGIPDDIDDFSIKGFLHIIKDKKNYDHQAIMNNPGQYLGFVPTQFFKDTRIEANPDFYHFQFGEYSGTFSIGYDGNPVIIAENGGNPKVDLSNYNTFNSSNPSTFKITTDNGYQYYFGGSRDNMEFSISYANSVGHASTRIYPNAFFLYKIVAANGRELHISYKKIPSIYNNNPIKITYEDSYRQDLKDHTVNFSFTGFRNSSIDIGNVSYNNGIWNVENSFGGSDNYVLTKIALIDEVICGKQKLKFNYSPRIEGNERFKNPSFTLSYRCGAMLDSVNLYYKDETIKSVKFQYDYYGENNSAFFLTKITMPDNGSYKFDYNRVNQLPNPMNADLDYWNFWQGGTQTNYPIPGIAIYKNMDYKYNTDIREPNPEYCDISLLQKIKFPTGGNAEIQYEPHLYSKKTDRKSTSSFMPTIVDLESNLIAGGARVRSISYSNSNNSNVKIVGYEYTNSSSDKLSSGILTHFPKYFKIIWYVIVNTSLIPIDPPTVAYSNTGLNIPSYEQDHVRYSTVREVNVENTLGGNSTFSSSVADSNTELTKISSRRIEKGVEYWTITGMKPGGYVDIYIKQNGITKTSFRLINDKTMKYFPNLESGDYDIYYQKSTFYGFYIKFNKQLTFEGPFKEVKFTDHITNPDRIQDDIIYCEIPGYNPTTYEINESRLSQNCSRERGKIISECSYDKSGNPFECTVNTYVRNLQGLNKYSVNIHSYEGFLYQFYKSRHYPFQLSQTIHKYYDRTGVTNNVITTATNFEYNGHNLLRKLTNRNSKNEVEINITNYSGDMQNGIYQQMKERNMLSMPVEKTRIKNNYVISAELFTYKKNDSNNDYVQDKVYESKLGVPKPYSSYVHYNGNIKDNCYNTPKIEYVRYDQSSNAEESVSKNAQSTIYTWGYDGQYPVAIFENAKNKYGYNDVYYENFEDYQYQLPAGFNSEKSYIGSFIVSLFTNPSKKYIIDYQVYKNGRWSCTKRNFEKGSHTINEDNCPIDDIRVYPKEASVTSYNFIPLVGVKSKTDARGVTDTYEYTSTGKLLNIKNTEQYLVKKFRSRYYDQIIDDDIPSDNYCNVTFDTSARGGDGKIKTVKMKYGEQLPIPTPAFGYTFEGWYDGNVKITTVPNSSNRTITAKFSSSSKTFTVYIPTGGDGGWIHKRKDGKLIEITNYAPGERFSLTFSKNGSNNFNEIIYEPGKQENISGIWEIYSDYESAYLIGTEPDILVLNEDFFNRYPSEADLSPTEHKPSPGRECRVFIDTGIWDGTKWQSVSFNETGVKFSDGSTYSKRIGKTVDKGTKIKIWARGASEERAWNQGMHGEAILGFYNASGSVLKSSGSGLIFSDSYEFTADGDELIIYVGYQYWYRD